MKLVTIETLRFFWSIPADLVHPTTSSKHDTCVQPPEVLQFSTNMTANAHLILFNIAVQIHISPQVLHLSLKGLVAVY